MQHATRLDLVSFEDPVFYDKMERARRQTTARLGMLGVLATMCQQLITLASLSGAVILFSPWFFLLLVLTVLPAFLGETRFTMLAYSMLYRWTPERRELDYLRMLGASVQSAKEVKIFGLGNWLVERSRVLFERFYEENKALAVKRAHERNAAEPAADRRVLHGLRRHHRADHRRRADAGRSDLPRGRVLPLPQPDRKPLLEPQQHSRSGHYISKTYSTSLKYNLRLSRSRMRMPAPRPIRSGYEFRDVSFSYPGSERLVLSDISFRLDAGEKIALIGENGAGKTTLVKLMARLYDPVAGQILLDGVDLREYSVEDLRSEIGVIFQDYMRYDMLAKENIGLGRIDELSTILGCVRCAEEPGGHRDRGLPHGFDQMLGRRFENGVDLSAGQWQKIALARAYMRDAQVLILDEPTASLDARAEYEVFLRFADLTLGKMAVLISHRFSTVRMANRILVLEDGKIREQGTHAQLVALGGRYAELFELQAAGYR